MADFNNPHNSRCWKDGYEYGTRSFHSGTELCPATTLQAAERWWMAVSDEMSMSDHFRAKALVAEFAGGFESAYVDCSKEASDG